MEYYQTKWDLLESQGKDRKDVRWVDRQMVKGYIEHNVDGYYFVIDYLKEEVGRLKKEKKSESDVSMYQTKIEELEKKVAWYKNETEKMNNVVSYLEEQLENKKWDSEIINKVYKYLTQIQHLNIDKTEFREWIENN